MANLWHDLTKWLEEASQVVGKEAGDLTLKGRLKLEIFELNRKLGENFEDLGQLVFNEVYIKKNTEWRKSRAVTSVIKKIKSAQRSLKKKQAEYKKVGKQAKKTTKRKRKK
jgi:hypothetical protein